MFKAKDNNNYYVEYSDSLITDYHIENGKASTTNQLLGTIKQLHTNKIVGNIYVIFKPSKAEDIVEIDYDVKNDFRSLNIATGALRQVTQDLFVNNLINDITKTNIKNAVLSISNSNKVSQKVAQNAGYSHIKTHKYYSTYSVFLEKQEEDEFIK